VSSYFFLASFENIWLMIYMPSVFEYTYILFWNSFWTIAPVIGIGVFDRVAGRLHFIVMCRIS
jgi:hypothetical protein